MTRVMGEICIKTRDGTHIRVASAIIASAAFSVILVTVICVGYMVFLQSDPEKYSMDQTSGTTEKTTATLVNSDEKGREDWFRLHSVCYKVHLIKALPYLPPPSLQL